MGDKSKFDTTVGKVRIKTFIQKIPGLLSSYRFLRNLCFKNHLKHKGIQVLFTEIYRQNKWGGHVTASGTGADLSQTKAIIQSLPRLFREYFIRSVLDIPCGDFNWMSQVDLSGIDYLGGDIVRELIENDKKRYSDCQRDFAVLDMTQDPLPKVDLILCRDGMVHLSYQDIFKTLCRFKQSQSNYLLATTFPQHPLNHDILTGDWRILNLEKKPFSFPPPISLMIEQCTEPGAYQDKALGLWRIDDLPLAL